MKKHKLSPLEHLRYEKKRLREGRDISVQRMSYNLNYLGDNWGRLIVRSLFSGVTDKISDGNAVAITNSKWIPACIAKRTNNPITSLVLNNLPLISRISWKMIKPTITTILLKKATSKLFGIIIPRKNKAKRK